MIKTYPLGLALRTSLRRLLSATTYAYRSIPWFHFLQHHVILLVSDIKAWQTSNNKGRIILSAQYYCNTFYLNPKITAYGRPHFWPRSFTLWNKMAARRNMRHNYFSQDATPFTKYSMFHYFAGIDVERQWTYWVIPMVRQLSITWSEMTWQQ